MKTYLVSSFLLSFLTLNMAHAKLVQILHTNDTHSFLNNTNHDSSTGGSARLKALMDGFKESGKKVGMETDGFALQFFICWEHERLIGREGK